MGRLHRIQEVGVFRSFHGDLSKENRVRGQQCQARHERKALGSNAFQFIESRKVVLLLRKPQVSKSYGIKIVVCERDEAKTESSQLDDLVDDNVGGTLSRTLTISSPNGAKRAVFGATANGLD